VVIVFVPCTASPQGVPLGREFRVNTYTTKGQSVPAVASDASGNFVVVWSSSTEDGWSDGVFGQRYASTGAPLGPEFRVNMYTTFSQSHPVVASDPSGNFVVIWESDGQDGGGYFDGDIFGQRYASTGAPLGPEFRVNTYTGDFQRDPVVASDSSGNFVVVWERQVPGTDLRGQRYASTGAPLGPEFFVAPGVFSQAVASDPSGNFVIIWGNYAHDGSNRGVFGQRYASTGESLGPEFRVNTYTTGPQYLAAVASDSSGNFVVVWESDGQDGDSVGVFGQRYASTGEPLGPEFRVNTFTTHYQINPAVVSDASGNFVIVWQSPSQDGSDRGVFGQRYESTGTPVGAEFRVNTYTTGSQHDPAVADSSGNFVVVWGSLLQDGSSSGVFGQRYSAIVPVELTHFEVE
jgi:hypothetical protein